MPEFKRPHALCDVPLHYCPGCTHGIIHRLVAEVIDEMGIEGDTIGVCPVGCSVMAYDYFNCDMLEASHGRSPAVATESTVSRKRISKRTETLPGSGAPPERVRDMVGSVRSCAAKAASGRRPMRAVASSAVQAGLLHDPLKIVVTRRIVYFFLFEQAYLLFRDPQQQAGIQEAYHHQALARAKGHLGFHDEGAARERAGLGQKVEAAVTPHQPEHEPQSGKKQAEDADGLHIAAPAEDALTKGLRTRRHLGGVLEGHA